MSNFDQLSKSARSILITHTVLPRARNLPNPTFAVADIQFIGDLYMRERRKTAAGLRKRFGSEYDRAVPAHGSEHNAEAKLADRETGVKNLRTRAPATERERLVADWQSVQSHIVDHPKGAVKEADELLSSLMQARRELALRIRTLNWPINESNGITDVAASSLYT
jgi:hypothetical protein